MRQRRDEEGERTASNEQALDQLLESTPHLPLSRFDGETRDKNRATAQ
jgi:hypothetical protein